MKKIIAIVSCVVFVSVAASSALSQTKCIWIENSENHATTQKVGVSLRLVKLLASSRGDFDINGVKMSYDSLLRAYDEGTVMRIKDSTGEGETRFYGGKFGEKMNEETERHNHIIIESSDSGESTKVSKLRVESLEAVGIVLAMIGSKNLDKDIDTIESALEQGGVFYARDYKKNSRLWIYVN
ncbi:MAG TPA: hypothetical protein VIS48_13515 [Candidatus Kryptonia bacterium]